MLSSAGIESGGGGVGWGGGDLQAPVIWGVITGQFKLKGVRCGQGTQARHLGCKIYKGIAFHTDASVEMAPGDGGGFLLPQFLVSGLEGRLHDVKLSRK